VSAVAARAPSTRAPRALAGTGLALGQIDWRAVEAELDERGCAVLPGLLAAEACTAHAALFDERARFRSHVDMARFRFGEGEYRYFAHPLPPLVAALREGLYPPLAAIANHWLARLGAPDEKRFPAALAPFLARCAAAGQTKPTPLLLRYETGGHNCLHQDVYGPVAFPLQLTVLLSRPGVDFTGGEFVLVEQRPRQQSRAEVVPLAQGDAVVFATRFRPVAGARGPYRVALRHGVSRLRSGGRHALGIIFHDAR
jgi:hypothetical protein